MAGCAEPRPGQDGTWITRGDAATPTARWPTLGIAHSVEAWEDDALVGGLYGVAIGRMFFGESMFARRDRRLEGGAGRRWCGSSTAGASR